MERLEAYTPELYGELFAALSKAQADMGAAKKDKENPFFKSSYADLNSVIQAAKKPLADNDLAVVQLLQGNGEGVSVETFLTHSSGQHMKSTLQLDPTKLDPQGYGSAITYMRRYAYAAIVGLAQADDDGNAASTSESEEGQHKVNQGDFLSKIKNATSIDELEIVAAEIKASGTTGRTKKALQEAYRAKKNIMETAPVEKLTDDEFVKMAETAINQAETIKDFAHIFMSIRNEAKGRMIDDKLLQYIDSVGAAKEIELEKK